MKCKSPLFVLFVSYFTILTVLLFWRRPDGLGFGIDALRSRLESSVNLIPFHTLDSYKSAYLAGNMSSSTYYLNIYGNAILFCPMGVLFPNIFRKKLSFFPSIFIILGIIVAFELLQLVFGVGRADIDDVILNLLGAVIGRILIYKMI